MNLLRLDQLKVIQEKYDASKSNFEIIILKGETGIGKTYLIESFLQSHIDEDVLIANSLCNYQTGKYEPYLPFKQLLRNLLDISIENNSEEPTSKFLKKALVHSVKLLVDTAPDLIDTFVPAGNLLNKVGKALFKDVDITGIVESKLKTKKKEEFHLEEEQIHKQYVNFLKSLSQESPIALVLEDIQWLDEASINLLLPLTQKLKDCPILFIGSYRSNEVTKESSIFPVLNELKRNLGNIEFDMDFKDEQSKQFMINSILDERENSLGEAFRKKLCSITNGNPMFVNELMHSLEENYQISVDSNGILQSSDDLDWSDIPEKLEAVVLGRLSKLEDETRALLSSASVQGSSFLVQVLGKIDQINDRDLLRVFARSLTKEHKLLKEGKVQRLNKQILSYFHFSNGLIQHYLYNDLMFSERMLYHQDIAEALVELYKEEYDQANGLIAYHYEKAEIPEKAIAFYENAGNDSLKISAFKDAYLLFCKAIDLADSLIEDDPAMWEPVKLRLLVQKSVTLKPTEGWISPQVIDLYNQAFELGTRLKDYETLAPVTFGIWVKHLLNLELDEALKYAKNYYETVVNLEAPTMILEAKISICNTYFWMGKVEKSLDFANQVVEKFDYELHKDHIHRFGQDPRAFAYLFKILSLSLLSKKEEAHELAEQSLKWAKSLSHPFTEAIILQAIVWLYFQEGESTKIKDMCNELIAITNKHNFVFYLGVGHIFSACWLLEDGDFEEAITQLDLGFFENLGKDGGIVFNSIYQLLKSRAELGLTKIEEALTTVEKAIEVAEIHHELVYYPLLLSQKAEILKKLNRQEEAVTLTEMAANYAVEKNLPLFND